MNVTTTLIIIGIAIAGPLVLAAVIAGGMTWLSRQVSTSTTSVTPSQTAAPQAAEPRPELRIPVWVAVALSVMIVLGPWYLATQVLAPKPEAAPSASAPVATAAPAPSQQLAVAPGAGNAANGEKLFTVQGCSACHSLKDGEKLVGPSLYHVGQTAAARIKDSGYRGKATTPQDYLRESITDPNLNIVPGFASGLMTPDFAKKFSAQDMEDLIAFLMTK